VIAGTAQIMETVHFKVAVIPNPSAPLGEATVLGQIIMSEN